MPSCEICQNQVPSYDLHNLGDEIVCIDCRVRKMKMAEKKTLLTLNVFEVPTKDGGVDHEVEISGSWSGLDIKFKTTIDQVRDFFTEKRKPAPEVKRG